MKEVAPSAHEDEPVLMEELLTSTKDAVVTGASHVPPPVSSTVLAKGASAREDVSHSVPETSEGVAFPELYADMMTWFDQQPDILRRMKREYEVNLPINALISM